MASEWESEQYDNVYTTGGAENVYGVHYRHSGYFPLFRAVNKAVLEQNPKSVFEVGCGTGGFAHLWADRGNGAAYRGFDFSPIAVERASARTGRPEMFFIADARQPATYEGGFDTLVCTEVLEHIEADLEVIGNWPAGTKCVCSVPNFEADNHVRVFSSREEVMDRYGHLISITSVTEIKKPYLFDLSWRSYARELRWNRYRPDRLKKILGLESFKAGGGWYLFTGRRKD